MRAPFSSKHSPSPISASARCASGRKIAARADASLRRHQRSDAAIQHFAEGVDGDGAHARVALGERVGAQQHHGAGVGDGERFADADGMRAHEIDLQFADLVADNADIAQFADAGGDGVGKLVIGDERVDDGASAIDGFASVGVEQDGALVRARLRARLRA